MSQDHNFINNNNNNSNQDSFSNFNSDLMYNPNIPHQQLQGLDENDLLSFNNTFNGQLVSPTSNFQYPINANSAESYTDSNLIMQDNESSSSPTSSTKSTKSHQARRRSSASSHQLNHAQSNDSFSLTHTHSHSHTYTHAHAHSHSHHQIDEEGSSQQQRRSRASGEILALLISEFSKNSNPSTTVRKQISDKTGMSERSVRIWFQNRRAKARKMEKQSRQEDSSSISNSSKQQIDTINNPEDFIHSRNSSSSGPATVVKKRLSSLSVLEGQNKIPIEVNERYSLIDCFSVSVGNWQRLKSGYWNQVILKNLQNLSPRLLNNLMITTDLLVVLSKKNDELNYFFSGVFHNEKVLFRIFYPLVNIMRCSLINNHSELIDNNNTTQLQIELAAPPKFAVHFPRDPMTGKENVNQWSICEDFSEGQAVAAAYVGEGGSSVPHLLTGPLEYLQYLNSYLVSFNQSSLSHRSSFPGPSPQPQILEPTPIYTPQQPLPDIPTNYPVDAFMTDSPLPDDHFLQHHKVSNTTTTTDTPTSLNNLNLHTPHQSHLSNAQAEDMIKVESPNGLDMFLTTQNETNITTTTPTGVQQITDSPSTNGKLIGGLDLGDIGALKKEEVLQHDDLVDNDFYNSIGGVGSTHGGLGF